MYSDHPRFFKRLGALPGVRRYQTGDLEMRAVFPVERLEQMAAIIRVTPWGGNGRGRPENLVREPGQTGTSAA